MQAMMRFLLMVIFVAFSTQAVAGSMANGYQIVFKDGGMEARKGKEVVAGKLEKREGGYSQWSFDVDGIYKNEGFEEFVSGLDVIMNDRTKSVIFKKWSADDTENGPYLLNASPSDKYVVFDYGTTTSRMLSVYNLAGKILLNDAAYYSGSKPVWVDDWRFQFLQGKNVPSADQGKLEAQWMQDPDGQKACPGLQPVKAVWMEFDARIKKLGKVDKPESWACME